MVMRKKQKSTAADIDNLTEQWEKDYFLNPVVKYYVTAEYMQMSEKLIYHPVY